MDRQAVAEDVVGLWDMVEDAWMKKHNSTPKTEVHIALFERAHTFIIHQNISGERAGRTPQPEGQDNNLTCTKCNNHFTDGEIKFLADNPSKPRICYRCTKGIK